ncbi:anti-sigma factor domain-containing protein [Geodermatophilus sp. URMC 64]
MSGDPRAGRAGDHALFDELAVGWALHALEPEDEAAFVRHLPDCARCARTVAETSDVMAAMTADLPPAEPSPGLRDRLRAAVERTDQVRPEDERPDVEDLDDLDPPPAAAGSPAPPRPATGFPLYEHSRLERPSWRRALPVALVAAAVAAILGLATWVVVLAEARDRAEAVAAQQSEVMDSLLQPGQVAIAPMADKGGHSVATVVARDGQVQVVAHGLSVNDRSRTIYVVWGMRDDAAVPLGTFDVVRPQMDLRTVGSDKTGLDDYPAYAISFESGRQMPSRPSDVVANGQVTS